MKNHDDEWNGLFLYFFIAIYVFMPVSSENDYVRDFSKRQLDKVPSDISPLVTRLDLSENNIKNIQANDFAYFLKLKFLNLSHNFLEELDCWVFRFNAALEHLEVSHNRLKTVRCSSLHFLPNIKHMDMSYNNLETMNVSKELSTLPKLKQLGLSALRIKKHDFINISSTELEYVFLGIEYLKEYEVGSLQLLHTRTLHINLPLYLTTSVLLYDALNTSTTLEVSQLIYNVNGDYSTALSQVNKNSKVSTLILSDITMPWNGMSRIIQAVWHSSVEHLYIFRFTIVQEFDYVVIDYSRDSLKSLTIDNIVSEVFFFVPPHPLQTFAEMLIENLTFSNSEMIHFFCPPKPSIFRSLSLNNNKITDEIFQKCENLSVLELLNLQNNKLERLSKISTMTSTMKFLKYLDLSKNVLSYDPKDHCNWSESLVFLNVSKNRLTSFVFACLPINLQILDLYQNQITSVPKTIENFRDLKELHLALNRLTDIPDCRHISNSLIVLKVDENLIHSPSSEFLHSCRHVRTLSVGKNPFQCTCDLRDFVGIEKESPGKLDGWPESYKCEYPDDFRGITLQDFHLSEISCNVYILLGTVLGTMLVFLFIILFLCIYFDLLWYIGMIFQWVRTKHRLKNINLQEVQKNKLFHAFISYSQEDSVWVKNVLIPNLERNDGTIQICHHERDFIPGKAITENIIDCIEKSFKSIFILSPNFVQSEWCHYELYFAQHTFFGKNSNNLILILLDPIPQYLIPNKYSKLKAIMKQRTYMEWPKEKSKHGLFWANLRQAIHINLPKHEEEVSVCNTEC
ncbi:toll-like receptor 6 [Rhinophrynus dorsalis]